MPGPVYLMMAKVEPQSRADEERLIAALRTIEGADPLFETSVDKESREIILHGQDELHLDAIIDILVRKHGVQVNVGAPKIEYRERLKHPSRVEFTHRKQIGGTRQFARVKLHLEPREADAGNEFVAGLVDGAVSEAYVAGVVKGVSSVWANGVRIGFPIVDMKVTLFEASADDDSSPAAFEIAARAAMKEGCDKSVIEILEPIMDVEVVTPGDYVGGIIGDINSRRGQIHTQEMRGNDAAITAFVPLAAMFGYVSSLRSITQGRATYRMSFSHYQPVPRHAAPDPDAFPPAIGMRA